jgi:hypothetical protein
MEVAPSATPGAFAAFTAQEVETAREELSRGAHEAQETVGGTELALELLAEHGKVGA